MARRFEYDQVLHELPEKGGAYVVFPWNIREVFGQGRVQVRAEFDGEPSEGSFVNMGLRGPDGEVVYLIGVRKDIRKRIGKRDGDRVHVVIEERD